MDHTININSMDLELLNASISDYKCESCLDRTITTSSESDIFNLTSKANTQENINNHHNNRCNTSNETLDRCLEIQESVCTECKVINRYCSDKVSPQMGLKIQTDGRDPKNKNLFNVTQQDTDTLKSLNMMSRNEEVTRDFSPSPSFIQSQYINLQNVSSASDLLSESTAEELSTQLLDHLGDISENSNLNSFTVQSMIKNEKSDEHQFSSKQSLTTSKGNSKIDKILCSQASKTLLINLKRSNNKSDENLTIKRVKSNQKIEPIMIFEKSVPSFDASIEQMEDNSLEHQLSMGSQSTIEEIYYMDTDNDICCTSSITATEKMLQFKNIENDLVKSLMNEKSIRAERIKDTSIDLNIQGLMNSQSSDAVPRKTEINLKEFCAIKISCDKGSENVSVASKIETENRELKSLSDDCKFQPFTNLEFEDLKCETKTTDADFIHCSDDLVKNVNYAAGQQISSNKDIWSLSSDSFLEFSIGPELDKIEKQETIRKRNTYSVEIINNLTTSFTTSESVNEDNREIGKKLIDLTPINENTFPVKNTDNLNEVRAENTQTKNLLKNIEPEFLTNVQSEQIENQAEVTSEEINCDNIIANPISNSAAVKDPMISNKNLQSPSHEFSPEFLSESQLQWIEKEAYMKAKEMSPLQLPKTKNITNQQDVFYKPESINIITEKNDHNLTLPNWVTQPVPEPNYDKIKCSVLMRRQHTQKMLDEILRLSTIVSKLGSIIHGCSQDKNSESAPVSSSHIQNIHPVHKTGIDSKNLPADLEISTGIKSNIKSCGNSTKNLKENDLFYVPPSEISGYNFPPDISNNLVSTSTGTNNINNKTYNDVVSNYKENNNFYPPQSTRSSKYDAPVIFNAQNNVKIKKENISNNVKKFYSDTRDLTQYNTSTIFGTLKHNLNDDGTCKPKTKSIWYNVQENENNIGKRPLENDILEHNKENQKQINTDYQMFKSNLNCANSCSDKMVSNMLEEKGDFRAMNRAKPVNNNTIFYLPDDLSSASKSTSLRSNNKPFLDVKNNASLSSHNFITQPLSHLGFSKSKMLNSGNNFNLHTKEANNYDGVFYNGNAK